MITKYSKKISIRFSSFPDVLSVNVVMLRGNLSIFRVVDTSAEKLRTVCVVFDVEEEWMVDYELSWLATKLVDQLDLSC